MQTKTKVHNKFSCNNFKQKKNKQNVLGRTILYYLRLHLADCNLNLAKLLKQLD